MTEETKLTQPKPLSPRQQEVMQYLVDGKSFKEIAYLMGLKVRTVRKYLARICGKVGAKTNFQCVAIFVASGQVTLHYEFTQAGLTDSKNVL